MSEIVGRWARILSRDADVVRERLEAAGVRFEFVPRGDTMEVRYQDTPEAVAAMAEYRLPPEWGASV